MVKNIVITALCVMCVLGWVFYFEKPVEKTWTFSTSGSAVLYTEECPK